MPCLLLPLIRHRWGAEGRHKRLEVLQGVGHWHCIEAADEVCELVKAFADGLSKG